MTPLNLDQLLRVAEEATPGPWERIGSSVTNWHDQTFEMEWVPNGREGAGGGNANWAADATYIATFDPPTVKALIEQNRALVEALRPFAEAWRRMKQDAPDDQVFFGWTGEHEVTMGDFRRGGAALLAQEEDA